MPLRVGHKLSFHRPGVTTVVTSSQRRGENTLNKYARPLEPVESIKTPNPPNIRAVGLANGSAVHRINLLFKYCFRRCSRLRPTPPRLVRRPFYPGSRRVCTRPTGRVVASGKRKKNRIGRGRRKRKRKKKKRFFTGHERTTLAVSAVVRLLFHSVVALLFTSKRIQYYARVKTVFSPLVSPSPKKPRRVSSPHAVTTPRKRANCGFHVVALTASRRK